MEKQEAELGTRHPKLGYSFLVNSQIYFRNKEYDEALEWIEKSVEILKPEEEESESEVYARALCLKGLILLLIPEEKVDSILDILLESKNIREKIFIDNNINISKAYSALGSYHFMKSPDDLDLAIQNFQKCLDIQSSVYGVEAPAHLPSCITYTNLAAVELVRGRWDAALEYQQKGLNLGNIDNGNGDIGASQIQQLFARGNFNMGKIYIGMGDYAKALSLLEKSLSIRQECFQEGEIEIALCSKVLAEVYLKQGEGEKAKGVLTEVLEVYEDKFGEEDKVTKDIAQLIIQCEG